MKKLLLSTSMLVAAGLAAPAFADGHESSDGAVIMSGSKGWVFDIGGFYTGGIGFVDSDAASGTGTGDQNVFLINDAEIIFEPSITSDNGLTFGAKIELEGQSGNIDESDMYVKGSFGTFRIGANDGAADAFAPGVTVTKFENWDGGFINDRVSTNIGFDANGNTTGDDIKISYFTPTFSGFSAGVSYIPSDDDEGSTVSGNSDTNAFELGAGYEGEFSGVSVGVSGVYTDFGDTPIGSIDTSFGVGASVGASGFTVSGSYGSAEPVAAGADDEDAFAVGLSYSTGPWTAGLVYGQDLGGANEDDYKIGAGVDYALAKGVVAGAVLEFADDDSTSDEVLAGGVFLGLNF